MQGSLTRGGGGGGAFIREGHLLQTQKRRGLSDKRRPL